MRERMGRFELYSFFDQKGIERRLSRMAERGWLLEKFGSWSWVYRRIEPKKLTFCVTYCPGASLFDPEPSEGQSTFYDFCEHTGWEIAASSAQMQVFYNQRENPVPIETDPVVMVDTIHRSKGSVLFANIALLAVSLFQGWMLWGDVKNHVAETLADSASLFSGLMWVLVIALCAGSIAGYYLWHHRAAQAAERGEFLPMRSDHWIQVGVIFGVLAVAAAYLISQVRTRSPAAGALFLALALTVPLVTAVVVRVRDRLKKRKVSKGVNLGVTIGLCVVLVLVWQGAMMAGVGYAVRHGWLSEGREESYEYNGHTFTAYSDTLPLTVEELLGVEYEGYSYRLRSEESFLTGWMEAVQKPRLDAADSQEMPYLSYSVATVKVPALYDLCRDAMLRERDEVNYDAGVPEGYREQYQAIDPAPWQAKEAYRLMREDDGPQGRYLLCYEGRIVEIYFDWEVSEGEMRTVAEQLGGRSQE